MTCYGVVLAGRRMLPLYLTGATLNEGLSAELARDGETFALAAARRQLPDACTSARGYNLHRMWLYTGSGSVQDVAGGALLGHAWYVAPTC